MPARTCSAGLPAGWIVGLPTHDHSAPIGEMLGGSNPPYPSAHREDVTPATRATGAASPYASSTKSVSRNFTSCVVIAVPAPGPV